MYFRKHGSLENLLIHDIVPNYTFDKVIVLWSVTRIFLFYGEMD